MPSDPIRPSKLGARASALWRELVTPSSTVERKVLAAEACRLTDRLDRLDRILTKDAAAPVMTEARLAATALQRILAALSDKPAAKAPPATSGGSLADELAARRASRQADSAAQSLPAP